VVDPGNVLLVAAEVHVPCHYTESITASVWATSPEVDIAVVNPGQCLGQGTALIPVMSLLAIPRASLPSTEVTVALSHTGASLPRATTIADLREPVMKSESVATRAAEVSRAIQAAREDALRRVSYPLQFVLRTVGFQRWSDTSLGCPKAGQSHEPGQEAGYVIAFQESDANASLLEYHATASNLAFCGVVSEAS
jgi:hypothetical protein